MLNTKQSGEAPLLLYQVLEDEYYVLNGSLPDTYVQEKQRLATQPPTSHDKDALNEALVSLLYRCMPDK